MSTVKIGWGTRIAFLYGGFVVMMVSLVILSMKQDYSLVSDDYYKEELAYQNTIDASKNSSALSEPAAINAYNKEVIVRFPAEFAAASLSGTVHFYSPVATSLDRKFDISASDNIMHIDRQQLAGNRYVVKLSWSANGKTYYQETDLNLQ
ncbi:FixH family protein [Polluticoccus soli]|uniref:FixH family protein n=1 Tax=Polluticoccus soli TaxID=3034150 RepID=UPI0023E2D441|nr:FixH family protein [Flavipsychrobacter sp. JY13-12]